MRRGIDPARRSPRWLGACLLVSAAAFSGCTGCNRITVDEPPPAPPLSLDQQPLESELRRLSTFEVDNTLRDVLLDETAPTASLLGTDTFTPYDNDYTTQIASAALVDSLEALTIDVARRALANPAQRARIIPCTPAGPDDAACLRTVIEENGRRLWRRPLESDEVTALLSLQGFATEASPFFTTGFDTAVELVLRALLLDPEFLFLVEAGVPTAYDGIVRLAPYELASRMSYFLWGGPPDDALLAAAADDALGTAAERQAVVERLLADPRARRQVQRFHSLWLGYRQIPHGPELTERFAQETAALLDRVVFDDNRPYLDVFLLRETFVDDLLADHYGLARPATSPGWVSTEDTERSGILGQGSVLSAFSKFTDTSPTRRGILIRSRLMCLRVDPPPPEVQVDQPPPATEEALCKQDRYIEHTRNEGCASCHNLMDPIGFGLENYDVAGRYRESDDGAPECVISGQGDLPGVGPFRGPRELAELIVSSERIDSCLTEQLLSFAHGRPLRDDERPIVLLRAEQFKDGGHQLRGLLSNLAASDAFAHKKLAGSSEPSEQQVQP